jgi:hypothetical protein
MNECKSCFVRGAQLIRVEYSAVTRANRELTWKLFSDWRRWQRFSDIYGDIRWLSGAPWTTGSRMRIVLVRPERTAVDHVIIACAPGNRVGWIDHWFGNTMEQWVVFEPRVEGGTRVHTWAEVVGPTNPGEKQHLRERLKSFIELWYSRFCRECDRKHMQHVQASLN